MSKKLKNIFVTVFSLFLVLTMAMGVSSFNAKAGQEQKIDSITIEIDTLGYNKDELPNALDGCTYPVFTCVAYDNLGNSIKDVETLVYFDANGDTGIGKTDDDTLVVVENSRFNTITGSYVIEYTARAQSVRKTSRLYIECVPTAEYVENNYNVSSIMPVQGTTGTPVSLPEGRIVYDDRFGTAECTFEIVYSGKHDDKISDVLVQKGYDCPDFFVPEVEGTYILFYTVENILGEQKAVTTSHSIEVTDSDKPILETPSLTSVFFVGDEVELPVAHAVQYYDGQQLYVPTEIYFNDQLVVDNKFIPMVEGYATVKYIAKSILDQTVYSEYLHEVMVYDVNAKNDRLFITNYFYFKNFTPRLFEKKVKYEDTDLTYTTDTYTVFANAGTDQAIATFSRATSVDFLELKIETEKKRFGFENLYVVLTDSQDATQQVELKFVEVGSGDSKKLDVYLNGNYSNSLSNKCFGEAPKASYSSELYLRYDTSTKTIIDGKGNLICDITSYNSGKQFDGFSSGKAFMSVRIDNVTSESVLILKSFATHIVNANDKDKTNPAFPGKDRGVITTDIGCDVVIKYIDMFDALDDDLTLKVKLVNAKGNILFQGEITEDYVYHTTEYGKITVTYTAYDSSGNWREKITSIIVVDRVAPIINPPTIKNSFGVGEEFTFPIFEATDNLDDECTTWVSVSYGDFKNKVVDNNKFKFEQVGTYVIKLNAIDSAGNYCIVSYTVVCQ